jgi:hypothetical protein
MRRFSIALAVASLVLLPACSGKSEPQTLPPPATAPTATPHSSPPGAKVKPPVKGKQGTTTRPKATATKKTATSVLPAKLVGAWRTITESGSAFSYELYADGKYLYNGIMQADGLRYTLQEGGRASVSGTQITFRPQQTVMTRTENGASTTTRPVRGARRMGFEVSGNRLTFTESGGVGSVYQRG